MGKTKREAGRMKRRMKQIAVFAQPDVYLDAGEWLSQEILRRSDGTWRCTRKQIRLLIAAGAVKVDSHPITERFAPAELRGQLRLDTSVLKGFFGTEERDAADAA